MLKVRVEVKLSDFTKWVCRFSIFTTESFFYFQKWKGTFFGWRFLFNFPKGPQNIKLGKREFKKKNIYFTWKALSYWCISQFSLQGPITQPLFPGPGPCGMAGQLSRALAVADGQQDATLCSTTRGTTSGLCLSLGRGGLLSESCHGATCRAWRGQLPCPVACGLALLCQVPVFLHVFFVCLRSRLPGGEPASAQCRAPQRPGCTWVSRSEIKQLQIVSLVFWQFHAEVLFFFKAKGQWLIQNLYFP